MPLTAETDYEVVPSCSPGFKPAIIYYQEEEDIIKAKTGRIGYTKDLTGLITPRDGHEMCPDVTIGPGTRSTGSDNFVECANEGGYCICPAGGTIIYGHPSWVVNGERVNSGLAEKIVTVAGLSCSNGVFGDPAQDTGKKCWCNTPVDQTCMSYESNTLYTNDCAD